jgi:hypothetical protein
MLRFVDVKEDIVMKRISIVLFALVAVVSLGCGQAPAEKAEPVEEAVVEQAPAPAEEPVVEARHDQVYTCACGPDCDCGAISMEAGNCGCGTEMVQAHLLKVDGNTASLCSCAGDCTCELNAEDPTKCSCGSDVKQVSLEGKGLYYCNCGGSCTCNHISAEAGKCGCGMDLVTS